MLFAVNYHYVRPRFDFPYPGIHGLTPAELERQLAVLGRIGTFVSAAEVRDAVRGKPLPETAILITFDDGLREQYEHAWPVLRRMGIPALFFINTAPLSDGKVLTVHKIQLVRAHASPEALLALLRRKARERKIRLEVGADTGMAREQYPYDEEEAARLKYLLNVQLDWSDRDVLVGDCFAELFPGREAEMSRELYLDVDQIRALDAVGCIGSHSHSHLPLGLLAPAAAEEQIGAAAGHLERWTGKRPFAFSYPYGSYPACSPAVASIAGRRGAEFAFTMERAGNRELGHPLHLARFDCNDVPGGKACPVEPSRFVASLPPAAWYRGAAAA